MPYKDLLERRRQQRMRNRLNKDKINAYERERRAQNPMAFRRTRLKTRYGITFEQYQQLYELQSGICALCLERPLATVDHDHNTGTVRGLLCQKCNVGLGLFGDSIDRLKMAIAYLERPPTEISIHDKHAPYRHSGESHPMARLTESDVRQIRAEHARGNTTFAAIGRAWKLDRHHVSDIVNRKVWRCVADT